MGLGLGNGPAGLDSGLGFPDVSLSLPSPSTLYIFIQRVWTEGVAKGSSSSRPRHRPHACLVAEIKCRRTSPAFPVTCPYPTPRPLADSEKLPVQKHRNAETSKSPEKEDIPVIEKKSKKPKKKEKKHKEKDRERRKEKERKVRPACGSHCPSSLPPEQAGSRMGDGRHPSHWWH